MSNVVVINGTFMNSYSQVLLSPFFQKILREYISYLRMSDRGLLEVLKPFKSRTKYDYKSITEFLYTLSLEPINEMVMHNQKGCKTCLYQFLEGLYSFWRQKQRFVVKFEKYQKERSAREGVIKGAIETAQEFENTMRNFHRSLQLNVSKREMKVFRQDPGGVQATFLVDKSLVPPPKRIGKRWMYSVPFIWSVVVEPPVIFYTKSNKRKGVFPVIDEEILDKIQFDTKKWYALPLRVGRHLIYFYINKEYLVHAVGLANLYELASPSELGEPDGLIVFGYPFEKCEPSYRNGIIYHDGFYVGIIPDLEENDYFGYAKKILLTVHNLKVIDEGRLPIHGSLAKITLKNGRSANAMFVGDSGAGKSETLDALGRLDEIANVEIIIDDMGSLDVKDGKIVAYGTETGAFVRLDDLPPGYAYATIDRSIFMNPNQTNARVIVPYDNYAEIIEPTPIDFFLYANNYTFVEREEDRVKFFKNTEDALKVFSEGARMAKGTTAEKGLSHSYFANPFGAIQRRKEHEVIAKKFVKRMFETGVKVGEIRTMLGVAGYEKQGTTMAARALAKLL